MTDLLTALLEDQGDLSAVDRFSRAHDAGLAPDTYRALIPATPPGPGQQYAFEVDLDACSGCKACVVACHSLNGLDDGESWRRVGTVMTTSTPERTALPLVQHVTSACHHCVDPACLRGCPVDAYDKDPVTGVVRHLDDQCIGCTYCQLMCPYEVPVFNRSRGIVRKCDLCVDRLAVGEAPACAQACPTEAIRIRLVDVAEPVAAWPLPDAPPPTLTQPTTTYRSSHDLSEVRAADWATLRPGHTHLPLAIMLVLTQLSVGAFVLDLLLQLRTPAATDAAGAVAAAVLGAAALVASVFHLGRPLQAWRAFVGLRHSWLSREIVAFGAYAGLAALHAAALTTGRVGSAQTAVLGAAAALAGVTGVVCSIQIYAVTGRASWRLPTVTARFAGTAAVCGLSVVTVLALATSDPGATTLAAALAAASVLHLGSEAATLRWRRQGMTDLARTATILARDLRDELVARHGLGAIGGIALPLVAVAAAHGGDRGVATVLAVLAAVCVTIGELLSRRHFFAASVAPRMPGGLP